MPFVPSVGFHARKSIRPRTMGMMSPSALSRVSKYPEYIAQLERALDVELVTSLSTATTADIQCIANALNSALDVFASGLPNTQLGSAIAGVVFRYQASLQIPVGEGSLWSLLSGIGRKITAQR